MSPFSQNYLKQVCLISSNEEISNTRATIILCSVFVYYIHMHVTHLRVGACWFSFISLIDDIEKEEFKPVCQNINRISLIYIKDTLFHLIFHIH